MCARGGFLMRIAIYKPHCSIWFKNPSRKILKRETLPNKYSALFDFLVKENSRIYIVGDLVKKGFVARVLELFRILLWVGLNKIDFRRIGLVLTRNKFEEMDVAIFMYYGHFTEDLWVPSDNGRDLAVCFSQSKVKKVVHMTHFAFQSKTGAENIKLLGPDLLVAENNLQKNSEFFMNKFGGVDADFYHLPYVPASRFKCLRSFASRINKLGVTGSVNYKIKDPDFLDFFGSGELQPLRRELYDRRREFSELIDTFMNDLSSMAPGAQTAREGGEDDAVDAFREYYKKDIVEFYNSYKMFAVPEEVCDLPGIGFIEGMACGAAYLGLDNPMYRDIGMVPGVHYVSYDGTLKGLTEQVAYYQVHTEELELIAEQGYLLACTKLSSDSVYSRFIERLDQMLGS